MIPLSFHLFGISMELINVLHTYRDAVKLLFTGKTKLFFYLYFLFLLVGAVVLLTLQKGEVVLFVNRFSNNFLDHFFLQLTKLGLGRTVAIIGLLILIYNFRWSLLIYINLAWTGIFTFLLKRILFSFTPRPLHYFYYDDFSRFLYEAPLTYYHSFPSGHTMTIFAFCSLIAVLMNRSVFSMLLFFIALLVGFSRIYLLQHFFVDIYFGSVAGILCTVLSFRIDKKLQWRNKRIARMNLPGLIAGAREFRFFF